MRTHRSAARATAYAQWGHDQRRGQSSMDHTDEIEMLDRALKGDLSPYSPQGLLTMSERLAWLIKQRKQDMSVTSQVADGRKVVMGAGWAGVPTPTTLPVRK